MSTGYVAAYAVLTAVLGLVAAWHLVILSRRPGPLWRAVAGKPGLPLQVCVALLLGDVVQLASDGRSSVGARMGLAVTAAILVYSGGVWLRSRKAS
jgi:hypothetical protein